MGIFIGESIKTRLWDSVNSRRWSPDHHKINLPIGQGAITALNISIHLRVEIDNVQKLLIKWQHLHTSIWTTPLDSTFVGRFPGPYTRSRFIRSACQHNNSPLALITPRSIIDLDFSCSIMRQIRIMNLWPSIWWLMSKFPWQTYFNWVPPSTCRVLVSSLETFLYYCNLFNSQY